MANEKNLKPWKPGQSGNPNGKPKGTKHLSTRIQNILQDESFEQKLSDGTVLKGAPVEAILRVLIVRAAEGDLRAFDLLGKYGYGNKLDVTSEGKQLPVPIYGGLSAMTTPNRVKEDSR